MNKEHKNWKDKEIHKYCGMVFVGILIAMNIIFAFLMWSDRDASLRSAKVFSSVAVRQATENADLSIRMIDHNLSSIAEAMTLFWNGDKHGHLYVHRLLLRRHAVTPHLQALFITSSDGKLLYTSGDSDPKPIDLSDHDYVHYHLQGGEDTLFIGSPTVSRVSGTWIIPVSRRIEDSFGRLVAVVVATIDPSVFLAALAAFDLPNGMRMTVIAPNGDLLGCLPERDCLGRSAVHWPVFATGLGQPLSRTEQQTASFAGPSGPTVYEISPMYGVMVATTIDGQRVLERWYHRLPWFLALAAFGNAMLFGLATALHRQTRRRDQAMAALADANLSLERRVAARTRELAEKTTALERSEAELRAFIDTAHDAILAVDSDGIVLAFNPAAETLFGYSANAVLGQSVRRLLPERLAAEHEQVLRHDLLESAGGISREMVARHRNSSEFPIEVTIGSSGSSGGRIHVAVVRDIREKKAQEEELWQLANYDSLTGLLNRRAFVEKGEELLDVSRRYGRPLSALMIDADHFKSINDEHGHQAGDEVLRTLARRLGGGIRSCDLLGRLGGEEFAILAPEIDEDAACSFAERILLEIRTSAVHAGGTSLIFSVSIGIAAYGGQGDLSDLLRQADQALYTAKAAGRNRYEVSPRREATLPASSQNLLKIVR